MQVATLRFSDAARVDTGRLNTICDQMGQANGEAVICAAMEDLAGLLQKAHSAWINCDMDALHLTMRQVSGIAERIGLITLTDVARDVADLAVSHDDAGLAATMARLTRLGEGSLIAIWDAQNISV